MLRLEEIMNEKGVSGKELAEKLNVTPTTITNIRKGKNYPKYELLVSMAKELDVDIRDLFYPTKGDTLETIYILKDGQYTPVGKLSLKKTNNG